MMLRRAALPLLRPRCIPIATRIAFSTSSFRGIRNDRGRLGQSDSYREPNSTNSRGTESREPLRKVYQSPNEHIRPQQSGSETQSSQASEQHTRPFAQASKQRQSQIEPTEETTADEPSRPLPDLRDGIPSDYDPEAETKRPLPDLRQGIPSTLDAELNQSRGDEHTRASLNITEDPSEETATSGRGGGDGTPRSTYVSSSDRKRLTIARYFYLSMIVGGLGYVLYLGRNWDDEEEQKHKDVVNGYSPNLMYQRAKARLGSTVSYYSDPVTTKLLPDQDPDPNLRPPFTLVLSMEDMLVHSEWTRDHGWRIAKRPGVDYFLKYLSQYYELVLFTSQPSFVVDQILRKLDPFRMIAYPLFREATLYKDGGYIKDLSYLNRDLKKVLIIDTDAHHVKNQPENAILLPKWEGNPSDKTLVDLIPFLEYLANMGFDDAREVLKSFEGKNIPAEFDRRQKIIRDKYEAQQAEKNKHRPKRSLGGLGSIFGTNKPQTADGMQSLDEAAAEGKMIWDQIRERGQKQYQLLEKRIQEEGAKWLAEQEAEEKKLQEEAMANMKSGVFSWFGGGGSGGGGGKSGSS